MLDAICRGLCLSILCEQLTGMRFICVWTLILMLLCYSNELPGQALKAKKKIVMEDLGFNDILEKIEAANFEIYSRKSKIPKPILRILSSWEGEKVKFVNRGKRYQKTDFVVNLRKSRRQIISILKSDRFFIMIYNHGGRGFHRHILFCNYSSSDMVKNIWIWDLSRVLISKQEIKREILNNLVQLGPTSSCY